MSQQQMNSDEINPDGLASYSARYEEVPHYNGYSTSMDGQKLSGQETHQLPTTRQRLALAIVSLVLWMLMFIIMVSVSTSGNQSLLVIGVLLFTGLIGTVNVVFNRRR